MIKSKFILANNCLKKSINNLPNLSKNNKELDEKLKEILEEEMNKECFDCGSLNPKYISINNGIFLCINCVKIHYQFPNGISIIKNNNLFLLTNKEILYIYYGGNNRLNHFVNYEYPGLQNYQPNVLYQTQAMNYYRKRLNALVLKRKKPSKPSSVYAYKLIGENCDKYSKNRAMFENLENCKNNNNINNCNMNCNTNENGKNLKYIYNGITNKKKEKKIKKDEPTIGSSYISNSLDNTFSKTANWNEIRKKKSENIKRNLNNNSDFNQNIYNQTFFEEMKNIFKHKNLKIKLRMKLNDKYNGNRIHRLRDELLTHQASLSNTIFFPNNNSSNNSNPYNSKLIKRINIHKFSSLRYLDKDKDLSINNNMYKIYIKPRMSNNSFSKNKKNKNIEINNSNSNSNSNYNRKSNSIINGMTKFVLKNVSLREHSPLNRKENGYIPETDNLYSKSITTRNMLLGRREMTSLHTSNNKIDNKLSNFINKINEDKINSKESSFQSYNRKIHLNLNDSCQSNNKSKDKFINEYIDSKREKRLYESNNLFKNNINQSYNSLITVNRINKNNIINLNQKLNINKSGNKNRNYIKVIKTKIGKRNNSNDDFNKIESFNLFNQIQNKINILNKEKKDIKNNIFLSDNYSESERILKAIEDKKEQEMIENEAIKKLLLNENYLFNNDIEFDFLSKNDNQDQYISKDININLKDKNEEIINGGFNKNEINHNIHLEYINNSYRNDSIKNNKNKYDKKLINEDNYFFNNKNCTDLILLPKCNNNKRNITNEKSISKEFIKEVRNILDFIKNKNNNNNYIKNKNNFLYRIKNNKNIQEIDIINNNSSYINNSKNSIRNKYKQKVMLNIEKKDDYNNNKYTNGDYYKNISNFIADEYINNNKDIQNINISEDNWNINQIGEINLYKEL